MTPFNQMHASRFMWAHPAHPFALGFGSGLSPVAPGTVGTLWAWASYSLLSLYLNTTELGGLIAAAILLGWWFCTVTAEHLQQSDPSAIVWDEIAAFWLVLWVWLPAGFVGQLVAFVLFRMFDAVKPGPVGWADRRHGTFGIMADDIIAGVVAAGILVAIRWAVGALG